MPSLFQFGGIATRRPVVRARVDDTGLSPVSAGQLQIVALLGTAKGGEPSVPILVSTVPSASDLVRGGDLLTALPLVFAPSAESAGASLAYLVRVNSATRASKTLKDDAANDVLTVTAVNWGILDNQIKIQIESGTNQGKKVSLALDLATYVKDDLYRESFSILFTGQSAAPENLAGTPSNGAGALTPDDYFYKVVSIDQFGNISLASVEEQVTVAASDIAAAVFDGTGLDDLTAGGTFSGTADATFDVEIDSEGTPDTFQWRKNAGSWTTGVAISGAAQTLSDGVTVTFGATTGHTATDAWSIAATAAQDTVSLTWDAVLTAVSYRIYRGTSTGAQDHYQTSATNSFTDLGAVGTVGTIATLPSACALTVNATSLATTVTGGIGGQNLSLTFANYPTVQSLVDAINAHYGYTATVLTTNGNDPTATSLDFVTSQEIFNDAHTVTSTLQKIIDWLNSGEQPLVTAARVSGAGAAPMNQSYTYLEGGGEGTATASDWQAALDALQAVDAAYVVALSGDAAIHAKVLAHINAVSSSGVRPRRAFAGGVLGEKTSTLSNYIARARSINSDRMPLLAEGIKGFDENGALTTLAPYFTAALVAGLQAGLPEIGEPLTHKTVAIQGLEWTPTEAEQELMLANGIMPIEQAPTGGFRIVRGITSWLANDDFNRVEFSVGCEIDEAVRRTVVTLDRRFLGHKATADVAAQVASEVETINKTLIRDGIIVAYRAITVKVEGDTIFVDEELAPTLPINFIGVTIHAVISTSTVTVAVR